MTLSAFGIAAAVMLTITGTAHAQTPGLPCEGKVSVVFMDSFLPMLSDYYLVITEAPGHYKVSTAWSKFEIRFKAIHDLRTALGGETGDRCPDGIKAGFSPTIPSTYGSFSVPFNGTVTTGNVFGDPVLIEEPYPPIMPLPPVYI